MSWPVLGASSGGLPEGVHTLRSVVHDVAQPGDTVWIEPGEHSAGVSLYKHLVLRGSRSYLSPLIMGDFIGDQMLRAGNIGFRVRGSGAVLVDGEYHVELTNHLSDGVPLYRRSECTTTEAHAFEQRQHQPVDMGQRKCTSSLAILRYQVPAGPRYWYISNTSDDLGGDTGDFYRVKSEGEVPPPSGWGIVCSAPGSPPRHCAHAVAPAPSIEPIAVDSTHFVPNQPSTLVGHADSALCSGTARWWLRRVAFSWLLGARGVLDLAAECSALWVTAEAAIVSHLTIASSAEALRAKATGHDRSYYDIHPAVDISSGSSATIAHCSIIGSVHVRGPRTMPLIQVSTVHWTLLPAVNVDLERLTVTKTAGRILQYISHFVICCTIPFVWTARTYLIVWFMSAGLSLDIVCW
jgi:hypothetical protein